MFPVFKRLTLLAFSLCAAVVVSACQLSQVLLPVLPTQTPWIITATTGAATQTPTASATPIPPTAPPTTSGSCVVRQDWPVYTIRSGDTLSRLAQRAGITTAALAAGNCIAITNTILVGATLRVPALSVTLPPPTTVPPTGVPPTPFPHTPVPVYYNEGTPAPDRCAVLMQGAVGSAALTDRPNPAGFFMGYLGNWAYTLSTRDGYIEVSLPFATGWVRSQDVVLTAACSNSGSQDVLTVGSVTMSSYVSADAGNFILRIGETITLTWYDAPAGQLINATFFLITPEGARLDLGTDLNLADGASIAWTVPAGLSGAQIMADGAGFGAASFGTAITNPLWVYSVP